jgi:hypothetical protein
MKTTTILESIRGGAVLRDTLALVVAALVQLIKILRCFSPGICSDVSFVVLAGVVCF